MANGPSQQEIDKKIKDELKELSFAHDELFNEYKKKIIKDKESLEWMKFIKENGSDKSYRKMFAELGNNEDLENLNTLNEIVLKLIENKTVDVPENFKNQLFEEWNKIINK